jgi:hypothetical protein
MICEKLDFVIELLLVVMEPLKLSNYDEQSGALLGEMMMVPNLKTVMAKVKYLSTGEISKFQNLRGNVDFMIAGFVGLREAKEKYDFLAVMLSRIELLGESSWRGFMANLKPMSKADRNRVDVNRTLKGNIGLEDAYAFAAGFFVALAKNPDSSEAVDEWINSYPAIVGLHLEYRWFRPMLEVVAERFANRTSLSAKINVTCGCILSLVNTWLCYNVLRVFRDLAETTQVSLGANALPYAFTFAAASFALRALLAIYQMQREPRKAAWEAFITLTGLLPFAEIYRAWTKQDCPACVAIDEAKTLPQDLYILISRLFETLIMTLPLLILDVAVNTSNMSTGFGSRSDANSVSVALHALSCTHLICFHAASYSFSWHFPTKKRSPHRTFEFVPDSFLAKGFQFASLMGMSAAKLSLFTSFLSLCLPPTPFMSVMLAAFLVLEFCGLCLVKVVRGDFWHISYLEDHNSEFAYTIFRRASSKFLNNVLGPVVLAHSSEFGGIWWVIDSLCCGFPLAWLSLRAYEKVVGIQVDQFRSRTPFLFLLLWLVSFAIFCATMEGKARRRFFSFETGSAFAMSHFVEGLDDASKCSIFGFSPRVWKCIRGDVEQWIADGWWRWENEKPGWFDEEFKRRVPREMIPKRAAEVKKSEQRRKRSLPRISPMSSKSSSRGASRDSSPKSSLRSSLRRPSREPPLREPSPKSSSRDSSPKTSPGVRGGGGGAEVVRAAISGLMGAAPIAPGGHFGEDVTESESRERK